MNVTFVKLGLIAALVIMSPACLFADDEASNAPVVRASESGRVYAKSVPEEQYGQKGRTRVFRVGADRDTLIDEYDWYSCEIYVGGEGGSTLIRFGPWQRGPQPRKDHLALGVYRNGKTVREYSTAEMERLGSGVSQSISHYSILRRRLGFQDGHVFEVVGVSGKVFSIELETGTIGVKPAEPSAGGAADWSETQVGTMDKGQVRNLASRAAQAAGYDLKNYAPKTYFNSKTMQWIVFFHGTVNPRPGNHLTVGVDDLTGKTVVRAGGM